MSAVNMSTQEIMQKKNPGTKKKEYISNTQGHLLRRFH